ICSWSHDGERYRVWVRNRPTVCAEHASFEEADIALADAICLAFGDGEGIHEYDRSRPGATDLPGLVTVVASVVGNGFGTEQNLDDLYAGGWCPRCLTARGARTAAPLRLSGIDGSSDGGMCSRSRIVYFSEGFLDLLVPAERDACEWRRIDRPRRTKKVYYELVGSRVALREAVLSPLAEELWHINLAAAAGDLLPPQFCELCGWESPSQYTFRPRGFPLCYVDVAAVPEPVPAAFTVGWYLCLSLPRWRAMLGKPGARGIPKREGISPRET
ncbi:MAG: hypothetical protein HYV19_05990, partial [Gemmatimonadetes bacterium]|nr:hypothetical protein [Gemmatimonadota bacterium]